MSRGGRPRFRSYIHAHVVDDDSVVLVTENGIESLQGRLHSSLAPFLDGKMTAEEIIAQVDGSLDAFDVIYGVDELRSRGYVADTNGSGSTHPLEPLAESLQVSPRRLTTTGVAVRSMIRAGTLPELVAAQGLRVVGEDEADFTIVAVSDYLDPALADVNSAALRRGKPWMLVRPVGSVVWVGPVFRPGSGGPCWSCCATRLRAVREAWRVPESAEMPLSNLELPAALHVGMSLAAVEAAKSILRPGAMPALTTFDLKSLRTSAHAVPRVRDCAACGAPRARRQAAPLVLKRRRKVAVFDGGHRAAAAEETFARYAHLVSPLVGVVASVERVPAGRSSLINVYTAQHNFRGAKEGPPQRSLGKGMTEAQSRTGALCEALERYSAFPQGVEPVIRASFRELGEAAIHPNACLGYSNRQYKERKKWNDSLPPMMWVAERFNETRPVDWVEVSSLTHETSRYVAAAYCYYGYRTGRNQFTRADSNGNAAGSSIEDALLQGLFELVERDAVAIWWYSRARRPRVEIRNSYIDAITREYAALGRRLWILDLTTDLGIPVFAAVSRGEDDEDVLVGFGAHLDPVVAATRAVAEVNQPLAMNRFAGRPRGSPFTQPLADSSFLDPHPSLPATRYDGVFSPRDDLRADILHCVGLLRRKGLEVLALDQTREDIGLPVVKVIVPGLLHFRPRFAPGRLYDVPLQLGWIERPLREEELNPSHLVV